MKHFAFIAAIFISMSAQGDTVKIYKTLEAVQKADIVNLICSDTAGDTHTHIGLYLNKGHIEAVKLIAITPAKSIDVTEFDKGASSSLTIDFTYHKMEISGAFLDGHLNPTFYMTIYEGSGTFFGNYSYNNNDGVEVSYRDVQCGATNYFIPLN